MRHFFSFCALTAVLVFGSGIPGVQAQWVDSGFSNDFKQPTKAKLVNKAWWITNQATGAMISTNGDKVVVQSALDYEHSSQFVIEAALDEEGESDKQWFYIRHAKSGKYLTLVSDQSGHPIVLRDKQESHYQHFRLLPFDVTTGWPSIKPRIGTNLRVTVNTTTGIVFARTFTPGPGGIYANDEQQFTFTQAIPTSAVTRYVLMGINNGDYISDLGEKVNGAPVKHILESDLSCMWLFIYVRNDGYNNYYHIRNYLTGQYLSAPSDAAGAALMTVDSTHLNARSVWKLEPDEFTIKLKNEATGYYMSSRGEAASGHPIYQTVVTTAGVRWHLVRNDVADMVPKEGDFAHLNQADTYAPHLYNPSNCSLKQEELLYYIGLPRNVLLYPLVRQALAQLDRYDYGPGTSNVDYALANFKPTNPGHRVEVAYAVRQYVLRYLVNKPRASWTEAERTLVVYLEQEAGRLRLEYAKALNDAWTAFIQGHVGGTMSDLLEIPNPTDFTPPAPYHAAGAQITLMEQYARATRTFGYTNQGLVSLGGSVAAAGATALVLTTLMNATAFTSAAYASALSNFTLVTSNLEFFSTPQQIASAATQLSLATTAQSNASAVASAISSVSSAVAVVAVVAMASMILSQQVIAVRNLTDYKDAIALKTLRAGQPVWVDQIMKGTNELDRIGLLQDLDVILGAPNLYREWEETYGGGIEEPRLPNFDGCGFPPVFFVLYSFSGSKQNETARLEWVVGAENSLASYIIEDSVAGAGGTFQPVATKPATGLTPGSSSERTLTHRLDLPPPAPGTHFYRLRYTGTNYVTPYTVKITITPPPVCSGDVTLVTQAQVDAFTCGEVTGNLTIFGNLITDLRPLRRLKKVGGTLQINGTQLTSLEGLDNITSVGNLTIQNNPLLASLTGLAHMAPLAPDNEVTILNNLKLTDLTGLKKVTSGKSARLIILANASLTSLAGLDSLDQSKVVVADNDGLTDISALQQAPHLTSLTLSGNASLATCCVVQQFANADDFTISNNAAGCSSLAEITTACAPPPTNIAPQADAGPDQTVGAGPNGRASVTLDGSGSSDEDGTLIRYVWKKDTTTLATGVNPTLELAEGLHTLVLTVTDDQGAADSDEVSITVAPYTPPPAETALWLEAECAEVGSHWLAGSADDASEGKYVTMQNRYGSAPGGQAAARVRFSFQVDEAGTYHVFGRVRTVSSNHNSFWLRINGGDWVLWGLPVSSAFFWTEIKQGAIALPAGTNTIDVEYREPSTYLDKLVITPSATPPAGLGETALNCSTPPPPPPVTKQYWLEAECAQVGNHWQPGNAVDASESQYVTMLNRYGSAPSGQAANRVRFTVEIETTGTYHIFGRVKAISSSHNSFWVRINNENWMQWGVPVSSAFFWTEIKQGAVALPAGTNTIDVEYREPRTYLDKLVVTSETEAPTGLGGIALNCSTPPPPPPVASEDVWLEAECAQGGTQWTEVASSLASNGSIMTRQGSALYTPSDQVADRLRFQFILDQAGQYYLFGRIRAMTTNRNSFWVRINGGEWMLWEQSPTGTGYTWYPKDGGAFALAAGVNTLDIGYREPNTNLDKLYLSTQSSAPSGYGVTASNCQSSRKAGTTRPAANVASWQVYPNPVATHLNIAWEGTHTVRLYNTLGVVVGEWRMTDQAVLPVAFLPTGVYYLQSEGQPTQKLVKP